MAAGDYTGKIVIYDLNEMAVHTELAGHTMAIRSLAFSPDERTLISGGLEGSIKFWQMETWQELGELLLENPLGECRLIDSPTKGQGLLIGTIYRLSGPADIQAGLDRHEGKLELAWQMIAETSRRVLLRGYRVDRPIAVSSQAVVRIVIPECLATVFSWISGSP